MNNTTNTDGINTTKRFLELKEALPFFPGKNGHMKEKSLRTIISRRKVPGMIRLRTGKIVFDRDELIGKQKPAA